MESASKEDVLEVLQQSLPALRSLMDTAASVAFAEGETLGPTSFWHLISSSERPFTFF